MSKLDIWDKIEIGSFVLILFIIGISDRVIWDKIYIIVMLLCWSGNAFIIGEKIGRKEHEI